MSYIYLIWNYYIVIEYPLPYLNGSQRSSIKPYPHPIPRIGPQLFPLQPHPTNSFLTISSPLQPHPTSSPLIGP